MKLRLLEIKEKYKDNKFLNELKDKIIKHAAKRHTIDEVLFTQMFEKTSKTYKVSRTINYVCNSEHQKGFLNYEQICYVCNCCIEQVEHTVRKLVAANLITHTRNKREDGKGNNLTNEKKEKYLCNPFKWVFKFSKKMTGMLRKIFPRSKGWINLIQGSQLNKKFNYVSGDDIEWFDELDNDPPNS